MMKKLEEIGVRGRMLKMIKTIYGKTTNTIITAEGISKKFETWRGVRQGCPLSSILFSIGLNDLEKEWERKKEGGTLIGKTKIYALKFADDVAMVADDTEGLK